MSNLRQFTLAWISGISILLIALLVWVISISSEIFSPMFLVLHWLSPVIASGLVSYLSPEKKILMGVLTTFPAIILVLILNFIFQVMGQSVDFPGFRGALALTTASLIWVFPMCVLGGLIGFYVSKWMRRS